MEMDFFKLAAWLTRACLWMLLPSLVWAQDSLKERHSRWIESAPPGIKRLIDLGDVSFEADDRELAARKKQGLAKFTFDYQYRYRIIGTRRTVARDSQEPIVVVFAKIQLTDLKLAHRVFILSTFDPKDPWKSPLLQHEFDHVSISTDPRLRSLLKNYLGTPLEIQLPQETPDDPDPKPLDIRIDQEIQRTLQNRVKEIERITQSLNDLFDKESSDGVRSIAQRERFFSDFFTVETLKKLDFKSPEIFEEYTKVISKSQWQEHYSLNAPL